MNVIASHMEQIAQSAAAIRDLPFPPPKIFTNALLQPHDITALIRDTEAHERALFQRAAAPAASRRSTVAAPPRTLHRDTAVGRILGGDLLAQVARSAPRPDAHEVDIAALLDGAERLGGIYPIPGAMERIHALRQRHCELVESIEHYEGVVAEQTVRLDRVHRLRGGVAEEEAETETETNRRESYTPDDFRVEEDEMRELEEKKRRLEDRVSGMQKDLGGLRR